METGVAIFSTHYSIDPAGVARLAESRGHESLFFPDHTHVPVSCESPYPAGGDVPRRYAYIYDQIVAMTAAALATTRLRIASGICLVTERDPIITAKQIASIDVLSDGRVEFGVGAGWNREEMANHGTDPRRRMAVMRERVEAIKAVWTEEEASYHGEHVDFEPIRCWPKPVQRPHPPVLVGGNGPTVTDRVLAFGDGWMPNYPGGDIAARAGQLVAQADRPLRLTAMDVPAEARAIAELEKAGFDRVVHWLPTAERGRVERALDAFEAAVDDARGG